MGNNDMLTQKDMTIRERLLMLRKERECEEVEMNKKLKLIHPTEKENNMIRQKEMKIRERLDILNLFKINNLSLKSEISGIKIVIESTLQHLNDVQVKCLEAEEKLDESKKEILLLRNERRCYEGEIEEKLMLVSIREK